MPRSPSPPRGPRRRSPSPRRDRDRDDRGARPRSRSRSPPRPSGPRRTKELSFYKKGGPSMGSLSRRRDPLEEAPETEKERLERRDRGEVPARFGGTREHGLRNTMATIGPVGTTVIGIGNARKVVDPLDKMGVRGEEGGAPPRRDEGHGRQKDYERERYERERRDRDRDRHRSERRERGQGERKDGDRRDGERRDGERRDGDKQREERMAAMDKPQAAAPATAAAFITVIANDRMGRKVEVKCLQTDTVGDLKKLIAAQIGTSAQKIILKKWYIAYKDHVTLGDYEINDGMSLEMY